MVLRIGIVGCGAIGSKLARTIQNKFSSTAKISYLCDTNLKAICELQRKFKPSPQIVSIDELVRRSDFIIEAASQTAASKIVPLALKLKKQVMVLSIGGLFKIPKQLLLNSKGLLCIPSGAVSGIDALLAAHQGKIKRVVITTQKPLKSLKDAPFFKKSRWDLEKIKKPTLIFSGNARTAISLFPQNINVAATLSFAGIGPERTQVRIMTSPTFTRNTHEIIFEGDFGRIRTITENIPSKSNPKTSKLAIYSAIACLEKILSSFKIGT